MMRKLILGALAFTSLIMTVSCSKKDDSVLYPVSGIVKTPPKSGTGTLVIGDSTINTTALTITGTTVEVDAGDYTVTMTFSSNTFSDGVYNSKTIPQANNEVMVMLVDKKTSDVLMLPENSTILINTAPFENTNNFVTTISFTGNVTDPNNPNSTDIVVALTVVK